MFGLIDRIMSRQIICIEFDHVPLNAAYNGIIPLDLPGQIILRVIVCRHCCVCKCFLQYCESWIDFHNVRCRVAVGSGLVLWNANFTPIRTAFFEIHQNYGFLL